MRAVLSAVRRLENIAGAGTSPTYDDGGAALSVALAADGPIGHRHERHYRGVADRMVGRLVETVATEAGAVYHRRGWLVDVRTGTIAARPHRVVELLWVAVAVQIVGARRRDHPHVTGLVAVL